MQTLTHTLAAAGLSWGVWLMAAGFALVCLIMMLVILIQKPKGGGLSGAFGGGAGGGSAGAVVGARVGDVLTIVTVVCFLLFLGLAMLFIEIIKATSTRSTAIANHAASMFVLLFCFVELLLLKSFATSEYFLLTTMCFLDVLAGAMVTIVSARRDFGVGDGFAG